MKNKNINSNSLYILNLITSKNNLISNVSDFDGNMIFWKSCGSTGYRNDAKGCDFAFFDTALDISKALKKLNISNLIVNLRGPLSNYSIIFDGLFFEDKFRFNIISIKDRTKLSFNGCRLKKKPRLRSRKSFRKTT